jgi:hypothetical protein
VALPLVWRAVLLEAQYVLIGELPQRIEQVAVSSGAGRFLEPL